MPASDELAMTYFVVCSVELTIGAALLGRAFYAVLQMPRKQRHNVVTVASLLLLFGDALTIINFWPREIRNAFVGELEGPSLWCSASAYATIATVTARA